MYRIYLFVCLFVLFGACSSEPGNGEKSGHNEVAAFNDAGSQLDDAPGGNEQSVDASQPAPDNNAPESTGPEQGKIPMGKYPVKIDPRGRAVSVELSAKEFADWNNRLGFQSKEARTAFTKELYKTFKDEYDFIFFVMNNTQRPTKIPFGQLIQVSNQVKGLGMGSFDRSADYGSSGKLKAVMQLARKDYLILGPSLHELAHNWCNFILDARMLVTDTKEVPAKPHWGVTDVGGQLGGFDRKTFKSNVDGDPNKYQGNMPGKKNFGFGSNGGNGYPYSEMELYLMGLIPKDKVPAIRVFSGLSAKQSEFAASGKFFAKKMTTYTIDQVIGAPLNKGARVPSHKDSQKNFRVLAVMLTPKPLTQDEWDKFDAQIARFSKKGDDGSRLYNFWEATGGKASLKMDEVHKTIRH